MNIRPYRSGLKGTEFLAGLNKGCAKYHWKGIPCLKMPIDFALYSMILWEEKPKTLIELGTRAGGSALWLADLATIMGFDMHIYSYDIASPPAWTDPRITWGQADVAKLEDSELAKLIPNLPRPLLVIDDSSHFYKDVYAILEFFSTRLNKGEMLVIEDGIASDVIEDHGLNRAEEFMPQKKALENIRNAEHGGGPSPALKQYHCDFPGQYEIDERICDFFGTNVTGNPNGYLRKT